MRACTSSSSQLNGPVGDRTSLTTSENCRPRSFAVGGPALAASSDSKAAGSWRFICSSISALNDAKLLSPSSAVMRDNSCNPETMSKTVVKKNAARVVCKTNASVLCAKLPGK